MRKPPRALALILSLAVFLPAAPSPCAAENETAVLIMAHGGSSRWNKMVRKAVKAADLPCRYRLFFGMGDTPAQVHELQDDVRDLESSGAHTIVVVPLLISSFSEIARQWKYLLGAGVQPGFMNNPLFPVERHSTIRFAEPLNDSSVVIEILLDRAQELSEKPANESVIIVSHGPNDDSDNAKWGQILESIATRIKERAGFHSVEGVTLRDDAPSAVRGKAIQELRNRIQTIDNGGGRTLVVLLLLAPGGIENRLALELRGLQYTLSTKALLPDSRLSDWIRSQVP